MTREEAITYLNDFNLSRKYDNDSWEIDPEMDEALDMAITALEAQEIDQELSKDELERLKQSMSNAPIMLFPSAQPTQPNTPNTLKSLDCIDRQAAIDGVKTLHEVAWKNWHEPTLSANVVIDMIKDLPSVQPVSCEDAVRREDVQSIAEKSDWFESSDSFNDFMWALYELPSAQPEPCDVCAHNGDCGDMRIYCPAERRTE